MGKLTIEQVQPDQIDELVALSRETFQATFEDSNTEENMQKFLDDHYNHDRLLRELETPGSFFYFVYEDGQLAGYLKLNVNTAQSERVDDNGLEVERIYLKKDFQGRGIGSRLLDHAEAQARKWHKHAIWLGVWEHNEKAKDIYAHKGYQKIGQHEFVVGDDHQIDYLFKKNLLLG